MKISKKTKWVSTDGWRGYEQPINAVAGANDTGTWENSPCPSGVCEKELKEFCAKLKKAGIGYGRMTCESSNVFCAHKYVIVAPEDHVKAYEIAKAHESDTRLFYSCKKI